MMILTNREDHFMTIKWLDWIVEDYKKGYGYVIKKRVSGSERWKTVSYHVELSAAVLSLFKERVRTETANDVVDTMDELSARLSKAVLLEKIDTIAAEITEGFSSWK